VLLTEEEDGTKQKATMDSSISFDFFKQRVVVVIFKQRFGKIQI
jgi:hypothetical protein